MKKILYLILIVLTLSAISCYVPSVTYKEVEESDPYVKTDILRQKDNGIMGFMKECNACWFYFDIIYDKVGKSFHMYISYTGDDWLFINKVMFLVDGDVIEFPFGGDRDFGYGDVYEWDTINISKQNLKKIVNAQNISCRLSGKYYFELTSGDMKPIQAKWKQFTNGKLKQYLN